MNGLNRIVARCNCNRSTLDAIRTACLTITDLQYGELQKAPASVRPLVIGTATPNGAGS